MQRFDGAIAGVGTGSGTRLVLGMWSASPFGPIADAMIERPDGHRILVAPSREVADFIAATYHFDEVRVEDVTLTDTPSKRTIASSSLSVTIGIAGRTTVGRLLALVPRPLARNRLWCRLIDPFARVIRRGVRTVGTAGGGRREYYCALDERAIDSVIATLDGIDLGPLRPVEPSVRFGFASTPPTPAVVAITTWVSGSPAISGG